MSGQNDDKFSNSFSYWILFIFGNFIHASSNSRIPPNRSLFPPISPNYQTIYPTLQFQTLALSTLQSIIFNPHFQPQISNPLFFNSKFLISLFLHLQVPISQPRRLLMPNPILRFPLHPASHSRPHPQTSPRDAHHPSQPGAPFDDLDEDPLPAGWEMKCTDGVWQTFPDERRFPRQNTECRQTATNWQSDNCTISYPYTRNRWLVDRWDGRVITENQRRAIRGIFFDHF